ncbi:1-acyl-sn-glycerol-3-phosphate acyltransferase [Amycolatopsis antarctica]|uniref:1-acyl-sn-glycerol-3-phosphate acyltransferase n=1 Tax=Amycolatopsis antarctica TaxID=1854586 RepID=A0A263CZR7_9PSEU|nr:lysophospholipid acyltransferase family protein [Amycolatopsis antarctica]OZM71674.1 1-acyl-sn-glycerol-3-phosphate acyltransferase [Amycolatopsis antarctica]
MTVSEAARLGLRFPRRDRGFAFALAIDVIWPMLVLGTRMRMRGREHIPRTGGVLVASNHLSFADPVTVTAFCLASGRVPRYLAKADLWQAPVIRSVMASGKHIPVHRGRANARDAYRDAVASVNAGECVVVFPESTFSDHPGGWPVQGKSGIARIALATGMPVVPVANWGTHHVLPPKGKLPRFLPKRRIDLVAGPPVDLSDLAGPKPGARDLRVATDRIMAAVTELLGEVRGEEPPPAP